MKKSVFLLFVSSLFVLSGCENVNPTPTPKPDKVERQLSCVDLKANNYVVGDVFYNFINNGGLVAKVVYTDNSSRTLEKDEFTCKIVDKDNINYDSHFVFTTVGSYDVTISRGSLRDYTYTIKVDKSLEPKSIVSIEASGYTSSVYQGDSYTFDGKVTAKYSDGTSLDVTSSAQIGTISTMNLGDQNLLIKYEEGGKLVITTIKITVKEKQISVKTLSGITVSDYTNFVYQGETYNFDGKVTATYSDKTSKDVTSSAIIGTISTVNLGAQNLNISYTEGGETCSKNITINVIEKEISRTLTSITLSPNNISVDQNSVVSLKDLIVVTAHYDNGDTANVTNKVSFPTISTKSLGPGNYNINYTEKGVNKTAVLQVTVQAVKVNSIVLNPASKDLYIDDYFTINATVLPENAANKSLSWTSSKTSVATVSSSGKVTAKAEGDAVITATAKDGSGVKATCEVHVSKVLIEKITFDSTTKNLDVGSSFTIATTFTPLNASNKTLTWTSSDSTVATVSSGKVSALKAGQTTITGTAQDGSGVSASCVVNVSNVLVSTLSITSTLTLTVDETSTLSPTITPSNATNKTLSWTSSKPAIASVDSNGKVTALTVGTTTITAKTTDGSNKTATCNVTVNEKPLLDNWTLLIYMCGADLESDYSQGGAATEDLTEIYSLRNSLPSDVNVVVQAGGASRWESTYSSVINKDKCNRFHLTKTGYVIDSQTSKVNMGLESSLESFVEWGLSTYPAEKVGLVFWNHGGAMDGCCFDEQFSSDGLTPAEVSSAIPTAISRSNYNQKLEFIGYDCCLMSIQDIAGLNSEYAKYMIASEEAEWGYGWTYNEWVDDLFAKSPTETILKACVDSFYSETEEVYDYWGEDNDQTLAYYNLQNWNAYETAWEDFSQYLSSSVIKSSSNWTTFKNVVNSAKKYGQYTDKQLQSYNNGYIRDIFDVKDFLNKFKASSSYKSNTTLMDKVSSVLTAFSGLGVYSKCGSAAGNSYGLCMFCPISGYNEKDVQYDENNTCFTYWRSLCRSYGNWYY